MLALFPDRIVTARTVRFRPANGGIEALRERRLGAVRLSSGSDDRPDPDAVVAALIDGVRQGGLALLPWSEAALSLRTRAIFANFQPLSDAALAATLDDWLPPLLAGKRRLSDIDRSQLSGVLDGLIGWDGKQQVDRLARRFPIACGQHPRHRLCGRRRPRVELRVQALYGLSDHPTVGSERIPLVSRSPPRWTPDPDDARPAGFLGGQLARRGQGNAGPLSAPSLA